MKKNYFKPILLILPFLFVGMIASAEDYYRVQTSNQGIIEISADQVDSAKVEGTTLNFYYAKTLVNTFSLENVVKILLNEQSILEEYQASLTNRVIQSTYITEGGIAIEWAAVASEMQYTTLKYTEYSSGSGVVKSVRVENTDNTCVINGLKNHAILEIISTYHWVGEDLMIDALPTAYNVPELLPVSKTGWSVISVSDETTDAETQTIFNDNTMQGWHSQWQPPIPPLPHWLVIDMLSAKQGIARIKVYRMAYNWADTKTVEFYVGNSPDASSADWELIGAPVIPYDAPINDPYAQIDIPATINTGRYLKLVLPDNHSGDDPVPADLVGQGREPYANVSAFYLWIQLPE
jgi:hypothetical protein